MISVPLWEGGFREGLVEERAAFASQAETRMEQARRDAVFEDARAKSAERAASAAFATAKESFELATELDPITFAAVPLVLATVAVLASYVSARRAASVDPIRALRAE